MGWRLPSFPELASLLVVPDVPDPADPAAGPDLPADHPFSDVHSSIYWSATADAANPANAWIVFFGEGIVGPNDKANTRLVWCVRGGMNADVY